MYYDTTFALIAKIMSYFFAAIVVYIVVRLARSVMREFSFERVIKKQDKGYSMGLVEIIEPQGKLYGRRFALKRENRIGRSPKCDICIKDRSVKSVQATIYQKGEQILLGDYGSRKGVYLNGEKIRSDSPLLDGDEIQLGDILLLLHLAGGTKSERAQREALPNERRLETDPEWNEQNRNGDPDEEDLDRADLDEDLDESDLDRDLDESDLDENWDEYSEGQCQTSRSNRQPIQSEASNRIVSTEGWDELPEEFVKRRGKKQ